MRQVFIALLLLAAEPALAASPWYEVNQTSGVVSTVPTSSTGALGSAQGGRVYKTTIDASGTSASIGVLGCASYTIVGDTVSGTYTPVQCESLACNLSSPCNSGSTCAVDEGCHEDMTTVSALKVTAATANDIMVLVCGKR